MASFEPVEKDRLYRRVVDQITRLILTGEMRAGDQLPTSSELEARFGVSRTAVREAVKALGVSGLVQAIPGRGTFVTQPSMDTVISNIHLMLTLEDHSFDDLMVVRRILEVPIASLAAQKGGPDDVGALAQSLELMQCSLTQPMTFIEHDARFHADLARATQSALLFILIQPVMKMLQASREMLSRVPDASVRALECHQQLFRAVAQGDAELAELAMRQHLAQVDAELVRARQVGLTLTSA